MAEAASLLASCQSYSAAAASFPSGSVISNGNKLVNLQKGYYIRWQQTGLFKNLEKDNYQLHKSHRTTMKLSIFSSVLSLASCALATPGTVTPLLKRNPSGSFSLVAYGLESSAIDIFYSDGLFLLGSL